MRKFGNSLNNKSNKDQLSFSFSFSKKKWTNNTLVLLAALALLFFSGRAAFRVYGNKEDSAAAALEAENRLKELTLRKAYLSNALEQLSTTEGKKIELRKKFGVAYPNERVAIIVEKETKDTPTSTVSWWESLKEFFR